MVFTLHSQTNRPGYGYILNTGATSLTEAWDARRGSSQNHFMLGHIIEWFYHDLAGIQPDPAHPGFKRIIIHPSPVDGVDWVRARYNSVRGPIASSWKRTEDQFELDMEIPPNTTATVIMPSEGVRAVTEGGRPITGRSDLKVVEEEDGTVAIEIGSGRYSFRSPR